MKNISIKTVEKLTNSIWVKFDFGEFELLVDSNGNTFDCILDACEFLRGNNVDCHYWELASYNQAILGNSEIDNF